MIARTPAAERGGRMTALPADLWGVAAVVLGR